MVQIMAWCRTGDKPLSEPMMTQFNDAYMRHSASSKGVIATQITGNLIVPSTTNSAGRVQLGPGAASGFHRDLGLHVLGQSDDKDIKACITYRLWGDSTNALPSLSLLLKFTLIIHNCGVIMGAMASQTTSLTIVYSNVYSVANQRKHQSFASLAFVRGIHWWPVNSPHKWPVTRKMFPFDDVIMISTEWKIRHWLVTTYPENYGM